MGINLLQSFCLKLTAVKHVYNAFNELTVAYGCLQHMWDFTAPSQCVLFTYNIIRITSGNLLIAIKPSASLVL